MSIYYDFGLMIWKGKSKGTLKNIKMMQNLRKSFILIKSNNQILNDKLAISMYLQK
jgi:hypothetical protein